MGRIVNILGLTAALCLILTFSVAAQRDRSERESVDSLLEKLRIHLDDAERDLADEYLDIVEQINDMIADYSAELSSLNEITTEEHNESLRRLQHGLQAGDYADAPQQLMDDINDLVQDLKTIESEQKAVHNTNRPQSARLVRNLRRQLVMQIDLIEDYTSTHVKAVFNEEDMRHYLAMAMEGARVAMDAIDASRLADSIARHVHDNMANITVYPVPGSYPVMVEPPEPPEPPEFVIVAPQAPMVQWNRSDGEVGSLRLVEDSLNATRSKKVTIINPSGGINVAGWSEDFIRAQLGVEVSAATRTREREFLDKVTLELGEVSGRYEVRAKFPSISDPDTKVLRSQLIVKVPSELAVTCSNSFGVVMVADLDNGLVLESQNSEITVDNVDGGANITNSMGTITISEVDGPLNVKNGYSPVVIFGCDGDMDIQNAYALVKLTDTRGKVTAKNSGQTQVKDHEGSVTIENTYGIVEVHDIEGSVTVSNAYSPIKASSITGSFNAENSYSNIMATEIDGPVSANSIYGQIRVIESMGPIDIRSDNGNVELVLYGALAGSSRVMTSNGEIKLTLQDASDLLVTARTTNGQITSSGSITVSNEGAIQSARMVYGDGTTQLDLSGTNTRIFINEH